MIISKVAIFYHKTKCKATWRQLFGMNKLINLKGMCKKSCESELKYNKKQSSEYYGLIICLKPFKFPCTHIKE